MSEKRPLEEEWEVFKSDAGGWVASHRGDGPIVVTCLGQTVTRRQERAALVAAAPDMARALLRFRNAHLGQDSAEEMEQALLDAETALAKAGVPL